MIDGKRIDKYGNVVNQSSMQPKNSEAGREHISSENHVISPRQWANKGALIGGGIGATSFFTIGFIAPFICLGVETPPVRNGVKCGAVGALIGGSVGLLIGGGLGLFSRGFKKHRISKNNKNIKSEETANRIK